MLKSLVKDRMTSTLGFLFFYHGLTVAQIPNLKSQDKALFRHQSRVHDPSRGALPCHQPPDQELSLGSPNAACSARAWHLAAPQIGWGERSSPSPWPEPQLDSSRIAQNGMAAGRQASSDAVGLMPRGPFLGEQEAAGPGQHQKAQAEFLRSEL